MAHTQRHIHTHIDIFFAETTSVVILRCKNTLALDRVVEANRPWSVSMRHPKIQKIYVLNLRRDIALKAVAILIQQAPFILINTAPDGQNNQKNMFLWVWYEVLIVSHNLSFAIPLSWMYYIKYHVIWDRIITRRDSMGRADFTPDKVCRPCRSIICFTEWSHGTESILIYPRQHFWLV